MSVFIPYHEVKIYLFALLDCSNFKKHRSILTKAIFHIQPPAEMNHQVRQLWAILPEDTLPWWQNTQV